MTEMTDLFSKTKRSWIMSRVKNRDTKPEIVVRSLVHRLGYRFRIHRRDLPGNPDIVLPKHKKLIFVHGCFWHGHKGCPRSKRPTTNSDFWSRKLDANIERDKKLRRKLRRMGWKVLVVWECETREPHKVLKKLEKFLDDESERTT
ncbi:MAG: very short patch repair endonuclease [Candidatus Hydrogenedentes bacterium]|nr:very short patch repair endonuclease [Candidatus Hydrogenedentota bacterium]